MLREEFQVLQFANTNNCTANQTNAQFLLGSGVYDVDKSYVLCEYSGMTTTLPGNAAGFLYARKDYCPNVIGSVCSIQVDGIQRFLSNSLAQTQHAYYLQEYSNANDKDMAYPASTHQSRTFWSQIGYSLDDAGNAQTVSQIYPIDQFFPGIFLKGQKFQIRSQAQVQMSCNKFNPTLGYTALATGKNNILVVPVAATEQPTTVRFVICLALISNQPFVDEKYLSVYDSAQFTGVTSAPLNRSFGVNELCYKQIYSFVNNITNPTIAVGQDPGLLVSLQIDRDGYKIVNATGIQQTLTALGQLCKLKTDHRCAVGITEDKFQNCTVQHNISTGAVAENIHIGFFILLQVA